MLLTIIAIVCWVLCIIAFTAEDGIAGFLGALVLGGGFILVIWALLTLLLGSLLPHTNIYENKSLVALQDGTQTVGSFFLGYGHIDGVPKYTYYVQNGGGYRLQNADAEKIDVYQDTDKPYIKVSTSCYGRWTWLVICNSGMSNTSGDDAVSEIHVPKNTIKQDFVLDAK